jgi:hypothetical protein
LGSRATSTQRAHRGSDDGMSERGNDRQHGKPRRCGERGPQPELREEQAGPFGVAEGPVVVKKPGNAGGAKGPWDRESAKQAVKAEEIGVSLPTLLKVEKLQRALHAKAKRSPGFRFYSLYDKVYRKDVLERAYQRCRANGGAAGVDAQTFEDITAYGEERWLGELEEELRKKEYCPSPVRRVWIPKANGEQRPLGILTIVLMVCLKLWGVSYLSPGSI